MGCCFGGNCFKSSYDEPELRLVRNDLTDEFIKKGGGFKLLLLGIGDSGKSTFTKQMTILHKQGFTEDNLTAIIPILRANTLNCIKTLITTCQNLNLSLGDTTPLVEATQLTEDIAKFVESIWVSPEIQKACQPYLIQLPGGASMTQFYLENAVRFAREDFLPTQGDMLRVKQETIGIQETRFEVSGVDFMMVDVSGRRSERKKWLTCFEDVSAVIFLAALNDYDMLEEDGKTNSMLESLELFQKLSESQFLKNTLFILLLNKSDLFQEKIQTQPLVDYFEDYKDFAKGNNGFETSCEFIKSHFCRAFGGNKMCSFITNALDTNNCESVFLAVKEKCTQL